MSTKTIEFTYEDKDYTLEYDAESVKKLEHSGFSFGKIEDHVLTAAEDIFYGAFEKNHKDVSRKKRREIWGAMSDTDEDGKDELSEALFEMINDAIKALKPSGNVKWRRG